MSELVVCQPYKMDFLDNYRDRGYTQIHIWAHSPETPSNAMLIRIKEYPVSCYIELPIRIHSEKIPWEQGCDEYKKIVKWLELRLGGDAFISHKLVYKTKAHYFSTKASPMIAVSFPTQKAMYHCKNLINKNYGIADLGVLNLKMLETHISVLRKLLTEKNVKFSQWITIRCDDVSNAPDRLSVSGNYNNREYIGDWETIKMVPDKDAMNLRSSPRVCSVDIECYSTNHRAMPKKYNPAHVVNVISCTMETQGIPDSRKKYVAVLGKTSPIDEADKIVYCKTELELIETYQDFIIELDPALIMGWNTSGFDDKYMETRLNTIYGKTWKACTKLLDEIPYLKKKELESAQMGKNENYIWINAGRIMFDMLPYARREFKFASYKLDYVGKEILGEQKDNISPKRGFEIYKAYLDDPNSQEALEDMAAFTRYCIQDTVLVLNLFKKLNLWVKLIQFSSVFGVQPDELYTEGQQIRCLSQIYDEMQKQGFVLDYRWKPYCFYKGAFVAKPVVGYHKRAICNDFNSLYPTIIIAYNLCYTTLVSEDQWANVPDDMCHIIEFSQLEPEDLDAYLRKNRKGPAYNIDLDDENESDDEPEEEEPEEGQPKKRQKKEEIKYVERHYKFKFVKANVKKGIVPLLLERLLSARNSIKKEIKEINKLVATFNKCIAANSTDILTYASNLAKSVEKYVEGKIDLKSMEAFIVSNVANSKDENLDMLVEIFQKCLAEKSIVAFSDIIDTVKFITKYTKGGDLTIEDLKSFVEGSKLILDTKDNEQLGVKLSANSVYGFFGAQLAGKMPLIEAALCVTAIGRQSIGKVNTHLVSKYNATVIYGDTDSTMTTFPGLTEYEDCHKWGHMVEDEINGTDEKILEDGTIVPAKAGLFLKPMRIEFEKAIDIFCICPKKYAYLLIDAKGKHIKKKSGEIDIKFKGLLTARRDNHKLIREIYGQVVKNIMFDVDVATTFNYIMQNIINMMKGNMSPEMLCISTAIGSNYKLENHPLNVFSMELAKMGNPVQAGDRLFYVVVKTQEEIDNPGMDIGGQGKKMRLLEMYMESIEEHKKPEDQKASAEDAKYIYPYEEMDYAWYIKRCINPLDQLFSAGYGETFSRMKSLLQYEPKYSRCRKVTSKTPLKFVNLMVKDYNNFYTKKRKQCEKLGIEIPYVDEREKSAKIIRLLETVPEQFARTVN